MQIPAPNTSSRSEKNPVVSFVAETVATGLGSGRWPFVAPATVGTVAALAVYWLLDSLVFEPGGGVSYGTGDAAWFFGLIGVTAIAGVWATGYIESEDDLDPSRGVIDEWVGMWVTIAFLPVTWPWMIAGFFMFRALDILKPLGIRRLEALPGGWGIMLDDIGAGILGAVVLNAVRLAFFP
ncbi:MAG: phosphatidylglycerophosphatase A [Dehalococcoidia bacterium]|nr:phosphatidylglycerophosphatase A [Dehalococcoidia bacterium]